MLRFTKQIGTLGLTLLITGCATMGNDTRTLRFRDAVTVTGADGRETAYKAGESIPMPSDPVQIESPGQVSMLVVPLAPRAGVSEIKMRKTEGWAGTEFNREVNLRLNRTVERVVEAQRALANRQGREALRIVEDLQNSYPELTYLDFLKASAYVLLGDREKARAAVESGLAAFPDNAAGRRLAASLSGGANR
jgi:hypothetical protein